MNILFFGSSKYSAIVEESLHKDSGLSLVVTIPDRPNRKNQLIPNPVKQFATINNIPVLTTDKLNKLIIGNIKNHMPDFLVVADYGLILPKELLELPKYAPLNVHHSLLPKYRGPSPAPTAILNGDAVSGVTIIKMTSEVDAGDILAQEEYQLKPNETTDSLLTKLNIIGGKLLFEVINNYMDGSIKPVAQKDKKATFTKKLSREDGFVSLENPPSQDALERMIRAYYPWPGTYFKCQMSNVKCSTFAKASADKQISNKIIKLLPNQRIQVEGKKEVTYKDFINGYKEGKEILQKLKLL